MANSWINYLNELPGSEGPSPPNGIAGQPILPDGGIDGAVLSDELRAQLAQWTTVSFGFDHSNSVSSDSPDNLNSSLFDFSKDNGLDDLLNPSSAKPDPSPYAKRPFGQFGLSGHSSAQQYGLERSFNAFAPTVSHNPAGISTSPAFDHSPFSFGLGNSGLLSNSAILTAPDGSHTLFASPAQSNIAVPSIAGTPNHVAPEVTAEAPATKKQRRTSSLETSLSKPTLARSSGSSASTPIAAPLPTPASLISVESPSTPSAETTPAGKALRLPGKQPLLTKAAILAAQAAELKAQASAALTAEEEAARTAELERIAVEDDKRRRNTAASARFRVKKKQREAGLEAQITELTNKLERLEKELEAARVENGFLRDLVIRKVGGDSSARIDPSPVKEVVASTHSSGIKMSGGQTGNTGMGTEAF